MSGITWGTVIICEGDSIFLYVSDYIDNEVHELVRFTVFTTRWAQGQ